MGIRSNVRNFFYATTHANQLIDDNQRMRQELAESKSIIEMQTKEIRTVTDEYSSYRTEIEQDITRVTEYDAHNLCREWEMNEKDLQTIAAQMRVYINRGIEVDDALPRAYSEYAKEQNVIQLSNRIHTDLDRVHSMPQVRSIWKDYNAPSDWVDEAFKRVEADLSKQDIARVAEHYSHYFANGGMGDNDIKAIATQMREYINSGVDPDDAFARATNEHENEKLIDHAVDMIRYEVGQGHSASRVRAMLSDPNQCVYSVPLPTEIFDEAYKRFEAESTNTNVLEPATPEPMPELEFELE